MGTKQSSFRWPGLLAAVAVAVAGLAGCGPASSGEARQVPPARMEPIGHSRTLSVVLTPLGARRIGIQTAPAVAAGPLIVVPYSALLYEPNGQTAVYVKVSALIYTRRFVTVSAINDNEATLTGGLKSGTEVVTRGGEELLGVQNGVGVET
jgi:hypothetical protein